MIWKESCRGEEILILAGEGARWQRHGLAVAGQKSGGWNEWSGLHFSETCDHDAYELVSSECLRSELARLVRRPILTSKLLQLWSNLTEAHFES